MIINKLTPTPDIEASRGISLIIEAVAWSPVASVSAEEVSAEPEVYAEPEVSAEPEIIPTS